MRLSNESMRLKNAYGVNEQGTLGLNAMFERYANQRGAANTAIAMHQQSGQSNATADESVRSLSQLFEQGLSRGFAGNPESLSQAILSLSHSMQYSGSGKNYTTQDAARMAGRLDQGFAAAATMSKDTDILAVQAAMEVGGGQKSLQEAREILEGGFSQNPELLSNYLANISSYSQGGQQEILGKGFGLSYTESRKLIENYESGEPISEENMRTIGDAQARLNPIQSILGETQAIRRGVAGLGETASITKEAILRKFGFAGREAREELSLSAKIQGMNKEELKELQEKNAEGKEFLKESKELLGEMFDEQDKKQYTRGDTSIETDSVMDAIEKNVGDSKEAGRLAEKIGRLAEEIEKNNKLVPLHLLKLGDYIKELLTDSDRTSDSLEENLIAQDRESRD